MDVIDDGTEVVSQARFCIFWAFVTNLHENLQLLLQTIIFFLYYFYTM